MKAIEAFYSADTRTTAYRTLERPEAPLGPRDLRVQVMGVSVNPIDYKVSDGVQADPAKTVVSGFDASGVVVEVGREVQHYRVGDAVYYAGSVKRDGANAALHAVDERIVGRKPTSLSHVQAAAFPLTALTAWEALFDVMRVPTDAPVSVLVLGAAGGVGSIAVQLLKQRTRATVIGTASRPESQQWLRALGADVVINHRHNLADQLAQAGHPQVDFVFCLQDTDAYFDDFAVWLKPFGHVASIVPTHKPVNLAAFMAKSLTFSWELMFTHSSFGTPAMESQRRTLDAVARMIDAGQIRSVIGTDLGALTPATLKQAHDLLKSGKAIGKIVMAGLSA